MTTNQPQLLELAIKKAKALTVNSMIRLTPDPVSLWVYNLAGLYYIGYRIEEPAPLLFEKRPTYIMSEESKDIAVLQRLIEAHH